MSHDFIQSVHVKDFGCLKDVTLTLSPLHALIGPNDSGKSTVLRALRTALQIAVGTFQQDQQGLLRLPFDPALGTLWPNGSVQLGFAGDLSYQVRNEPGQVLDRVDKPGVTSTDNARAWNKLSSPGWILRSGGEVLPTFQRFMTPAGLVRLNADALRKPSQLIPSGSPLALENEQGAGLVAIYDAIVNRDVDSFTTLRDQIRKLFPTVKNVGFRNVSSQAKQLEFELIDGSRVGAELMSEGLLYYMAIAALPYLEPTRLLLLEEPENGLHPSRIQEVMRVLRELSKKTQIILATHSPLVINELQADEVTVLTRTPASGSNATLLKDTHNFEERSKVYALGELWLSYANGGDEGPLLRGESWGGAQCLPGTQ